MTLPETGFGAVSSVMALTSAMASGAVSKMLMVRVLLLVSPLSSLTTMGMASSTSPPVWFLAVPLGS